MNQMITTQECYGNHRLQQNPLTPRERNLADIGLIALRFNLTRHDILQRRGRKPRLTDARIAVAKHFLGKGKTLCETARIMERNHTTVRYYLFGRAR